MIKAKVVIDDCTKNLIRRIKQGQIAIIDHQDLDQLAAKSLVEKKVKAVVNISKSITGKYPNNGPGILMNAGIPLMDVKKGRIKGVIKEGHEICIYGQKILLKGEEIASIKKINKDYVDQKLEQASNNFKQQLTKFINNTLDYALWEKDLILNLESPEIPLSIKGKQVLVVVRGSTYKDDLETINNYIREVKPLIIGVDGGADACLESGYLPDIIIGDMDSVSNKALKMAKLLIVHAYPDGTAPGLARVKNLGLNYILFPAPGTSEDIALILAYQKEADLIVAVGTHTHMIDFLEKGRPGMSSTLLARLKTGDKLIDARGVSKLYQSRIYYHYWLQIAAALLVPLIILFFSSPAINNFFQLLVLKLRLIIGF